ncbi:MAG: hypothetical protein IK140_09650 [Clostridia bacterium]|nr:hypothetical protein [Clostridia bacterium]
MKGQRPSNFNPQGQLCRPEEEKSRRAACRPGVIFLTLQIFRPEMPEGISEKTVSLPLKLEKFDVSKK